MDRCLSRWTLAHLARKEYLGGTHLDFQMDQYVYKRKNCEISIINLKKIWESAVDKRLQLLEAI